MNRPPSIDHRRFEDPADDRGACRLASDACSRGAEHRLENCAPRDQGTLETALQYTALGLRVFPLRPRTKQPLPGLMWKQAATTDPQTIRAAWEANPGANVGVVCGEGVFVLDADSPRAEAALAGLGVPRTIAVRPRTPHLPAGRRTGREASPRSGGQGYGRVRRGCGLSS